MFRRKNPLRDWEEDVFFHAHVVSLVVDKPTGRADDCRASNIGVVQQGSYNIPEACRVVMQRPMFAHQVDQTGSPVGMHPPQHLKNGVFLRVMEAIRVVEKILRDPTNNIVVRPDRLGKYLDLVIQGVE